VRRVAALFFWVGVGAALGGAATAEAAGKKIAIVALSTEGLADDVREQFETLVEEGLRKVGYQVTTRSAALDVITSRELPEGCTFGPCARTVGEALRVDRLLDARISAEGQSYSFVLSMVDARSGVAAAQVVGSCGVCTVAEALTRVGDSIQVLEGGALAAPEGIERQATQRKRSKLPPILLSLAGAAAAGGGALLVTQTAHDDAGWVTIGAGGTALLTGLIWLLVGD